MDKRNFYNAQNVQPEELNGLVSVIDQAIGEAGYETGGRGVVYGLQVGPTSPVTMAAQVTAGTALFYNPATTNTGTNSNRRVLACRLSAQASISLTADYLGASTAVSAGQERWASVVIRPKTVESDPHEDGAGATVNFVQTEAGELVVVAGTAAAAGSAVRPDVSTIGIRLADVLIGYGTTSPTFSLAAREDYITTLPGGSATNNSHYSLFWQAKRNPAAGTLRAYLCAGGLVGVAGLLFTINAAWVEGSSRWECDTTDMPSIGLRLGAHGFEIVERTTQSPTHWVEGDNGNWEQMAAVGSDGNTISTGPVSVVVPISIRGTSAMPVGMGAIPSLSAAVAFPHKFAATPATVEALTNTISPGEGLPGFGEDYDQNVDQVYFCPTQYGLMVTVLPTAAGVQVVYNRLIRVTQ